MTKITDINGAAMQPLRSIKKPQISESFQSKLKDDKLKQTSEEIVSALLSNIKSSDEYILQLHSKMSDIVLGRLASLKASTDVSQADLLELKDAISADIQKTGLSNSMKEQLLQSVSTAINNTPPSEDSSKVIEELKKLDEQLSLEKQEDEKQAAEEDSESTQPEEEQQQKIEDIKEEFSQQMAKMNDIPNAVDGNIQKSFKQLNKTISKLSKKTTPQIQKQSELVGKQLGSVQDSIAKKTESIGKSFEQMKDTTAAGFAKRQQEQEKTVEKINPLKKILGMKNEDPKFENFKKKFMPDFLDATKELVKDYNQFILDLLKRNIKRIHKALKKTIDAMTTTLVVKIAKSVLKILTKLAEFLGDLIYKIVGGIMKGLFAPFKPVLIAIAVALGLIMAAVIMAMFKFPELVKPIAESLAKLAELMAKTVVWLIQEVWTWVSGTLWPFLKEEVWGFISGDFWTFIKERVFPIVERIYKWIYEEFWPFLCKELWPFILKQVGKIFTWLEKELWPFVLETFKWLKNVIIIPVWNTFVMPVLQWIVGKVIPWIAKHVKPIIMSMLEVMKEFYEALTPWIQPIFGKMFKIIDWLLKLLQKVFKILEPGIMAVVNCVKNLFVGVFDLLKEVVISIVQFIEILIKAFKQAWNSLCDYFADVEICIKIPESWRFVGGKVLFGPYYPLSGMRALKFDGGGSAGSRNAPAVPDNVGASDSEALEKLDNYIDTAYGKIFMYLRALVKLLGIDTTGSKALQRLGSAMKGGVKSLRKEDASKKLDEIGDSPVTKIIKSIDKIASYLDKSISPAVSRLAKALGHQDLVVTVKADEVVKDQAKEAEGIDDNQDQQAGFDANEFVNELFGDESSSEELKTDEDNAFSFLANNVFPYMKDNIQPLVMRIRELADSIMPSNNSVVNIVEESQPEEMNYALVDQ